MKCLADKKHFYLHEAARHGSVEAIKVLLEYFDANGKDSHGKLPHITKEVKLKKYHYFEENILDEMFDRNSTKIGNCKKKKKKRYC